MVNEQYVKNLELQNEKLKQDLAKSREYFSNRFSEIIISLQMIDIIFSKMIDLSREETECFLTDHGLNPIEDSVFDLSACLEQQKVWSFLDMFFPDTEIDIENFFNHPMYAVDIESDDIFDYQIVKNTLIRVWKGFTIPKQKTPKPAKNIINALQKVIGKSNCKLLEKFCLQKENEQIEFDSTIHYNPEYLI